MVVVYVRCGRCGWGRKWKCEEMLAPGLVALIKLLLLESNYCANHQHACYEPQTQEMQ
jgi:hypothetical protein